MAENQEMSPIEIKVARQIEVILEFCKYLAIVSFSVINSVTLACSITSEITIFRGTDSSKNNCSLMMAG